MNEMHHSGLGFNQRLRQSKSLRALVRETSVSVSDVIFPLFIRHGQESFPIKSMPGQMQWCLADLKNQVLEINKLGINAVMLFGIPDGKDDLGKNNTHDHAIIPQAIRLIKDACPDLVVMSDMCLCDYSSHGHCMVLDDNLRIDRMRTLAYLQEASLTHARAGADVIAPSGMVDHMCKAIRSALDEEGFAGTAILSYAAKFYSALYSPFREACDSAPKHFDRASYQLDPANRKEALKETLCDINEGADMVMVKPAMHLDIVRDVANVVTVPVAVYQVSGEYSMIVVADSQGLIDKKRMVLESLTSIKRAGADMIITYFAKEFAQWMQRS